MPIDARYDRDLTTLMWAAGHSNEVPSTEGVDTVKLLLARGASLEARDDRGRTALMIAAQRGHAQIVTTLLAVGADPKARDREGQTATDLTNDTAVLAALLGDG